MNDDKLEQVLQKVEPEKRAMLKKLVVAAGFAVPVIASFSVTELAQADIGSMGITTTLTVTNTITSLTQTSTFTTSTTSTTINVVTTTQVVTVTTFETLT